MRLAGFCPVCHTAAWVTAVVQGAGTTQATAKKHQYKLDEHRDGTAFEYEYEQCKGAGQHPTSFVEIGD